MKTLVFGMTLLLLTGLVYAQSTCGPNPMNSPTLSQPMNSPNVNQMNQQNKQIEMIRAQSDFQSQVQQLQTNMRIQQIQNQGNPQAMQSMQQQFATQMQQLQKTFQDRMQRIQSQQQMFHDGLLVLGSYGDVLITWGAESLILPPFVWGWSGIVIWWQGGAVSKQIVGNCPICGAFLYTYPTYPAGWKKVHTNCLCFEVTEFCFTEYYSSLEQFCRNGEEDIDD